MVTGRSSQLCFPETLTEVWELGIEGWGGTELFQDLSLVFPRLPSISGHWHTSLGSSEAAVTENRCRTTISHINIGKRTSPASWIPDITIFFLFVSVIKSSLQLPSFCYIQNTHVKSILQRKGQVLKTLANIKLLIEGGYFSLVIFIMCPPG